MFNYMLQVLKYLFPSPLCLLIHWMVLSWVANINFIPIFFFFCCFFICNVLREYHLCKCIKLPFSKTTWMHHKFKAHLSTKHHLSRYTNLKGRLCRGCDFSLFCVVFISFYLFFLHKQTVKKLFQFLLLLSSSLFDFKTTISWKVVRLANAKRFLKEVVVVVDEWII